MTRQFANQGNAPRGPVQVAPSNVRTPPAPDARKSVADFAKLCDLIEPTAAAVALTSREAARMRRCVARIDSWLDRFMSSLP
jgi:hypothetical protein